MQRENKRNYLKANTHVFQFVNRLSCCNKEMETYNTLCELVQFSFTKQCTGEKFKASRTALLREVIQDMAPANLILHHLLISVFTDTFVSMASLYAQRRDKDEARTSKCSKGYTSLSYSHLIGLNGVTCPHLATGDSGKCSLELNSMCSAKTQGVLF